MSMPSNNVVCLLTSSAYRHGVKRGDLAFWLFLTLLPLCLVYNSNYPENQQSYMKIGA